MSFFSRSESGLTGGAYFVHPSQTGPRTRYHQNCLALLLVSCFSNSVSVLTGNIGPEALFVASRDVDEHRSE